jgi:hypothetical protein
MAIPLSAYDRKVIDAGYKFIPQTQYLLNPFQIPTAPSIMDPVKQPMPIASGITSLQSQGGGGALQAGDINYNDFAKLGFDAYSRRQPTPLVDDLYQSKLDKSFFGFPSYTEQELTGPDMGEYIASNTDIPLELTRAGQLQSGLSSIGKGITGLASKMKGGPLTSVISMLLGGDKFDTLPALDQQFIEQSMGYRGPTVFGENTSGLYKDPFGVNTRSLRGNYAEKVRDDFSGLTDSLTGRLSDKYGATFNTETGMFESDDEEAAKKANKMTEMMRKKYNFRQKQIKQQEFDKKIADQQKKAEEKAFQERVAKEADTAARARAKNKAVYESADRQGFTNDRGGFSTSAADRAGTSVGSGQFSPKSSRGRSGYINGGIVDILDIYY